MIALKLHKSLYQAAAVDEAVRVYGPHATLERGDEGDHFVVRIVGSTPAREHRVAGELGNYALGVTIKTRSKEPS
jgi:hypothetical protein